MVLYCFCFKQKTAYEMRISDWSSDVCSSDLLCQLGLQFMPDRQAALREMRRVLVDGGRLAFNVPGPMPRIFAVMGEAIARHVGAQAAGFVGQVFSLHDAEEIRSLVGDAG